jgi:hypothetical protein
MALGSDPYAVLGVPRDATDSEIAQARRRLSREYHPDVNSAPGAAARFDEVQQAFHLLSDQAARAEYDRTGGRPGTARVARDHGLATEAAPGIFIQPTSVDFGLLAPRRPSADAKVTVAWTGAPPGRITSEHGSEWWTTLGSEMPASSCVVFYLRAEPHAGAPNGRQHAQFTVTLDDTAIAVQLTAEIQGVFPPASPPAFGTTKQALSMARRLWIAALIIFCILILLAAFLHSGTNGNGLPRRRRRRHRRSGARVVGALLWPS